MDAIADPVCDIIGDYRGFAQARPPARPGCRHPPRSAQPPPRPAAGVGPARPLRTLLDRFATASLENVWNGRPISLILLRTPLEVLPELSVPLIELISPVHQRVYKLGLEHLGASSARRWML